jgi:transposase
MDYSYYLGVDISKNHLDLCLIDHQHILGHWCCQNTPNALRKALRELPLADGARLLICAEHTGKYGYILGLIADELAMDLWMENPAQIKLSSGIQRGKSDPADAEQIACYARRHQDKAVCAPPETPVTQQLRHLSSLRRMLVSDRAKYKAQLSDEQRFIPEQSYKAKCSYLQPLIDQLTEKIIAIEQQLRDLIAGDPASARQMELMQSIPGVGPRLALAVLLASGGFTRITCPRKFSCHAGVAPFHYHSGKNTHSRARVSHRADKQLKSLLHMAALSVVGIPGELQEYYNRKCEEGKTKMSVLNAVRSKLVHRIFAVIKRDEKYRLSY